MPFSPLRWGNDFGVYFLARSAMDDVLLECSTLTAEPRPLANGFSMPELPEVEIARRSLERWLGRSEVTGAEAEPTRIFRKGERADFEALRGKLAGTDRHGKVLLVAL